MTAVISRPSTEGKLRILSEDSKYDLACACSTDKSEHRVRGGEGRWIYPVTTPNGGKGKLLKTLISNVCGNDCVYCPLRDEMDVRRVSLTPDETADVFMDYYRAGRVFGLFLSSGVCGTADGAMQRLNDTAEILRNKHKFRGYIHLKVLPGACDAAVEQAVSLASNVSINIETPGEKNLRKLSKKKDYIKDIIGPMKLISRLTERGSKYERVKQTTQFIVGAAGEDDRRIVNYMDGLYTRLGLNRVYFSAYQPNAGHQEPPGLLFSASKKSPAETAQRGEDLLTREHRLYQVDFLMRKYGFSANEIPFAERGRLDLAKDPKELWAQRNPQYFPVNINRASKERLLRVPGLGPITVNRIIKRRSQGRLGGLEDIGKVGARLAKASTYITF